MVIFFKPKDLLTDTEQARFITSQVNSKKKKKKRKVTWISLGTPSSSGNQAKLQTGRIRREDINAGKLNAGKR